MDIEAAFEEDFGLEVIGGFVVDMWRAIKNIKGDKIGGEKDQSSQKIPPN